MQSAVDLALEEAARNCAIKIHALRLRVGALSGTVPEALQFAFESLTSGTIAEGARLEIESVAARFWCGACSQEFAAGEFLAECPGCKTPSRELRSGREIQLASMEID